MTTITTSDIDSDHSTVDRLTGKCDQANQHTYCNHHYPKKPKMLATVVYNPLII